MDLLIISLSFVFLIAFGIAMFNAGKKSLYKNITSDPLFNKTLWEMHEAGIQDSIATINKITENVEFYYDKSENKIKVK